jgi:hypothetical protein
MMGNLSEKDYKGVVSNHLISNCPISTADIDNSRVIHGPALASGRGMTVRRTPAPVVADYVAVPRWLVEQNKMVTLAADVFFVDGTAFLMTISRRIKFITGEHVPVRTAKSLAKHIKRVVLVYARADFTIRTILMDGEFEKVKDQLADRELEALRKNQKAEVTLSSLKAAVQQIKNMVFEFKSQIENRTQHIQELDRLIESYKQQEQDLQK